jgi:hypothetical protein
MFIRKTGNLLFLLEQAGKAIISGQKCYKHMIIKQGLFLKSIMSWILYGMLSLLDQGDESRQKHNQGQVVCRRDNV